MFNILVVEDDKNLRRLMTTCLKKNNYNAFEAVDGAEALEILDTTYIDLIISDIMMPNMDGYRLTKELREANYNMPILMVTAKDTFEDKRTGFLAGIDDYMVKPIDIDEMILRVGVLLKRANIAKEHKINIGDVLLDYNQLILKKGQTVYQLRQKEFRLLFKLLSFPDKIFTRQELMNEIWGLESETEARSVDVHIKRLREKLININEFEILTIRGLGYKAIIK